MEYNEIIRLQDMLKKANIPFSTKGMYNGFAIRYPSENKGEMICSIIEHDFSYGHKQDLLEIMGLLTEKEESTDCVIGFLSADEVFNRISNDWKKTKKKVWKVNELKEVH